jgi:hypothetical protein
MLRAFVNCPKTVLPASPFNKDLSNETSLSLIHLAGQYVHFMRNCLEISPVPEDFRDRRPTEMKWKDRKPWSYLSHNAIH